MKNTIKAAINHYNDFSAYEKFLDRTDIEMGEEKDNRPIPIRYLAYWNDCLIWKIREKQCNTFGHKIEHVDHCCGPETGCEVITCTRCGQSWEETYY